MKEIILSNAIVFRKKNIKIHNSKNCVKIDRTNFIQKCRANIYLPNIIIFESMKGYFSRKLDNSSNLKFLIERNTS